MAVSKRERARLRARQYYQVHPERYGVTAAVFYAVKRGDLIRPNTCEICGRKQRVMAHHESYAREDWLTVVWLCAKCHRNLHQEGSNRVMKDSERRSHAMASKHWAVIDAVAERMGATASTGSRVGLPSWRSLLYQIATGRLLVVRPTYPNLIISAIKALNRLPVAPAHLGKKRSILAALRAHIDPEGD